MNMKKRIAACLSIILLAMTLFSSMTLPLSAADPEAFGTTRTTVTSGTTYTISNQDELARFSQLSNASYNLNYSGVTILLTADITITKDYDTATTGNWIPLVSFYGIFDGGGHTVTVLCTRDTAGFISNNYGTIENLTIAGTLNNMIDFRICGGIVAYNMGTVSNCCNAAAINLVSPTSSLIGGIAAGNTTGGKIINCRNTGTISCPLGTIGGICGSNIGMISVCSNTGSLSGGLVGGITHENAGSVFNCSNTGSVTGIKTGGIACINSGHIANSFNNGSLTGDTNGGVFSTSTGGTISACYNSGTLTGSKGGIGNEISDTEVKNCYWLRATASSAIATVNTGNTTQDLVSFNTSGVLSAPVGGTTNLLTAINDWVVANQTNTTDYVSWEVSETFPTFTDGKAFGTTRTTVTEGETYTIGTQAELARFAQLTLSPYGLDYFDVTILLTADITVTNDYDPFTVGNWTSIRDFRGIFDGDGHTVVVQCSDNYSDLGFFAINTGTIQNLTLGGSVNDLTNSLMVGGITATNYGMIINCRNNAYISPSPNTGYMGGIAANNSGTIIGSCNTGRLDNLFHAITGGIAGLNNTAAQKIINCYNSGSVSGSTCGGIVGDSAGSILNCYNIGSVSGNNCGGILGYGNGTSIYNCYNSGIVTGPTSGGIFGRLISSAGGNCFYLFSSSTYAGNLGENSTISPIVPFNASCTLQVAVDDTTDLLAALNKWVYANQTETTGYYGWKVGTPYPEFTQNPVITTETLANGTQNTPYSATLFASGPLPITWTLTAGALPPGLSLSSSGVLSGTPTMSGAFNFIAQAENEYGTATRAFTFIIKALQSPLSITGIPGTIYVGDTFSVSTTGGSGTGMLVYIIPEQTDLSGNPTTGVATIGITNGLVTIQKVGKFKIRAGKVGDNTYADSIVTSDFITVGKAPVAVNFTGVPTSVTYGDAPLTVGLSGNVTAGFTLGISNQTDLSGNPTTGVASINSSGLVTILKSGKFQITAARSEDDTYAACSAISGVVIVNKAANVLTLTGVPASVTYGDASFTVATSGGNGTGVRSFNITNQTDLLGSPTTGVAIVNSSGVVTILKAGRFQITAAKAADDYYVACSAISGVITVNKKALTVTGIGTADKDYDNSDKAAITGVSTAVIMGRLAGDDVSIDAANAYAYFSDTNAGNAKTVTFAGFALKGVDAANYSLTQPASVKANVRLASPDYTLPGILTATEGQKLADITLPKDKNGVFTFDAPLTTPVGTAGERNFTVTFSPYDTLNYKTVTGIVLVINVKATAAASTASTPVATSKTSAASTPATSSTASDITAPQMGSPAVHLLPLLLVLIFSAAALVLFRFRKSRLTR